MSQTWKTIRVFISSTFKDMQAERDHLVRYVFPKLREELLTYRIHLIDVDLRWGVTSDQDATGVCREMIDECHPRFLCILGGRYGWVPDGKEMSITADEIHYSVLDREVEKRGHAFFYFRDDETTAKMVEETNGEYREPDGSENSARLEALKQKIKNAGLPDASPFAFSWGRFSRRLKTSMRPSLHCRNWSKKPGENRRTSRYAGGMETPLSLTRVIAKRGRIRLRQSRPRPGIRQQANPLPQNPRPAPIGSGPSRISSGCMLPCWLDSPGTSFPWRRMLVMALRGQTQRGKQMLSGVRGFIVAQAHPPRR